MDLSATMSQYFKTLKRVHPGMNFKNMEMEAWRIISIWEHIAFNNFYDKHSPLHLTITPTQAIKMMN